MSNEILTEIKHYGIKRRSGRYPYGSGKNPYQDENGILFRDSELRKQGYSEKEIAEKLGMSIKRLREEKSIENHRRNQVLADAVDSMTKRGDTIDQIAKALDISPRTVSNIKNRVNNDEVKRNDNIKQAIKEQLAENPYLDISEGIERQLGISRYKFQTIVRELRAEEGLYEHTLYLNRLDDPNNQLTVRVLTPEEDFKTVHRSYDQIGNFERISEDGGRTMRNITDPVPVDPKRVSVVFDEDGGSNKDGLIELRRGVDDLDMGEARYAQVRIQVGDKNYLKGMAVYADDLPPGIDIRFNTNKSRKVGELGSMKELKDDPENPFGSTIAIQKGALNMVNYEGKWSEWNKAWSSQFLSKQPAALVQERLDATLDYYKRDYEDIMQLTNPTVQKYLLQELGKQMTSAYKHLQVQSVSRSATHVILPFEKMNPNEVYAPNYRDGEKVVLVRYPHAGTFELAELTVNNKFKPAREMIGTDSKDAIGIHPSVAQKMSGADFDGDFVTVIPNNSRKVKVSPALEALKNFDPSREYRVEPIYKVVDGKREIQNQTINEKYKNKQMGIITNLITDMQVQDATDDEVARAVKHSMVIIDSYKHNLDYKKSAEDNAIKALQRKYQSNINPLTGKQSRGAGTLLSKKLGKEVLVDYEEIEVLNEATGRYSKKKVGGRQVALIDAFDDARKLSTGTAVENTYADYINATRKLRDEIEAKATTIKGIQKVPGAAKIYEKEVKSIDYKLNEMYLKAPRERQAQLEATRNFYTLLKPGMNSEDRKKLATQVVAASRAKYNPYEKSFKMNITPKEWEAIENGAVSKSKLEAILKFGDTGQIRSYATPKPKPQVSAPSISRAKALLANGYTYAEVADQLGISTSAVYNLVSDSK